MTGISIVKDRANENILKAIINATLSWDLILMQHMVLSTKTALYTINFNHFQNILEKENGNSLI